MIKINVQLTLVQLII